MDSTPNGKQEKHGKPWVPVLGFAVLSWLLIAGIIAFMRVQLQPEEEPVVPSVEIEPKTEVPGWKEIDPESPLARATDVAFVAGSYLAISQGKIFYDSGNAVVRPIEVAATVSKVLGASDWLFAQGENEGFPVFVRFSVTEAPKIVPMPCVATRMAGYRESMVAACEDSDLISLSDDAGKTFLLFPVGLPRPRSAEQAEIQKEIEAVAIDSCKTVAIATSQRWLASHGSNSLLWTWGQVAVKSPGQNFRFSNVDNLVRSVGLTLSGGAITLAGLEVSFEGLAEGELRTRIFRGPEGEPPVGVGEPGPRCGTAQDARSVEGVLLGTQVAAFLCQGDLVLTMDGGASWKTIADLSPLKHIRGGDMRLWLKGDKGAWERRFINRSETGATAVRVSGGAALPQSINKSDKSDAKLLPSLEIDQEQVEDKKPTKKE